MECSQVQRQLLVRNAQGFCYKLLQEVCKSKSKRLDVGALLHGVDIWH